MIIVLSGTHPLDSWARNAFKDDVQIRRVSTVRELVSACQELEEPAAILTALRDSAGAPVAPSVRAIKGRAPQLPVIVHCPLYAEMSDDIREMALAGADELLFAQGGESAHALRVAVAKATLFTGAQYFRRHLMPRIPQPLHDMFEFALCYPKEALQVSLVARALGVHRKTLVDRCARANAPPPGTVIQWARLLIATWALRSNAGSVEVTTNELEFSSATAFRNILKRYSGLRPRDVRAADGLERLIGLCVEDLNRSRSPGIGGLGTPRVGSSVLPSLGDLRDVPRRDDATPGS